MHRIMFDGTLLGIGDIIRRIGTHGDHIIGIIITVNILTGILTITDTLIIAIIIVIHCIKIVTTPEVVRGLLPLIVIK